MRLTVDTNILVYAMDRQHRLKQRIAYDILNRGRHAGMVLAAQVLGEFVNAVRRKNVVDYEAAIDTVDKWAAVFPVVHTGLQHIIAGGRLASRHRLQFWDSVILEIARSEGVGILFTEDMQDGMTVGGVTLLNPFQPENITRVDELLAT